MHRMSVLYVSSVVREINVVHRISVYMLIQLLER